MEFCVEFSFVKKTKTFASKESSMEEKFATLEKYNFRHGE